MSTYYFRLYISFAPQSYISIFTQFFSLQCMHTLLVTNHLCVGKPSIETHIAAGKISPKENIIFFSTMKATFQSQAT